MRRIRLVIEYGSDEPLGTERQDWEDGAITYLEVAYLRDHDNLVTKDIKITFEVVDD